MASHHHKLPHTSFPTVCKPTYYINFISPLGRLEVQRLDSFRVHSESDETRNGVVGFWYWCPIRLCKLHGFRPV